MVLPPLYSVIQTSLFTTKLTGEIDQFTLRYYEDLLRELQVLGPFLNTFYFAVGSALLATLLGGSIAWIVVRTDSPLRGLGYFTAFASFGTPFILYTIGWLLLLGKAGPVNYWLKVLLDQTGPVINVYSMFGMILIESLLWSPFVFLMLAAAFRSMDPSLEEASAACGARVWQTMRRISLRLMLPAFFSVMLLIFIRTFESFEIPALVGLPGDIRVLTTSIYLDAQKLPPRYGSAGAFSVLLMIVVAATLYFYFRLTREGDRYQTVTGKGYRPTLINLGRWRYLAGAGLVTYSVVLLVLPFLIILWASVLPYYMQPSLEGLTKFTLKNYVTALHFPKITDAIKNSVLLGLGSASFVMVLTLLASWLLVRTKIRGRWLLDLMTTLPLLFPGIVMGLAILRFYLFVPIPVYGTLWISADRLRHALHSVRHPLHPLRFVAAAQGTGRGVLRFRRVVVQFHAPHHPAADHAVVSRRLDFYFSPVRQRVVHVGLARQPANTSGVRGDLRTLGKRSSRRTRRLRRDLDRDSRHRGDFLLRFRAPLRYSAELK